MAEVFKNHILSTYYLTDPVERTINFKIVVAYFQLKHYLF